MENIFKKNTEEEPTIEEIALTEEKIGHKLPALYIELCKLQNGGEITKQVWLTEIYGIKTVGGIAEANDLFHEFGFRDTLVPFGETQSAGHDCYCFDYTTEEPRIVLVDTEMCSICLVAENFKEFIDMVCEEKDIFGTFLEDCSPPISKDDKTRVIDIIIQSMPPVLAGIILIFFSTIIFLLATVVLTLFHVPTKSVGYLASIAVIAVGVVFLIISRIRKNHK